MELSKILAGAENESDLNNSDAQSEEEQESPMQVEVQGKQNLTVVAGTGSVVNINNYKPPNEDQSQLPSHGGSATPQTIPDNDNDDEVLRETDGAAGDEETIDEVVDLTEKMTVKAPQQRRLVLIGYTGGGKSETGNSILFNRDLFESLPSFASITKDCHKSSGKDLRCTGPDANEVVVVDTPGLFDTNDDPEVIAKRITECIIKASPGPHAILFVMPIARMTPEVLQAADGLRKLFGDRSLQYMIVVFTHLDAIKRKKNTKGIKQIIDLAPPALNRILQECNNRYVEFDNTLDPDSQENKDQVVRLLDLVDTTVEANGGHFYTNDLLEEANRLMEIEKKRHEKEIEEKFKDREARIRAEYDKYLDKIEIMQKELAEVNNTKSELETNIKRLKEEIQKDRLVKENAGNKLEIENMKKEIEEKEEQLKLMSKKLVDVEHNREQLTKDLDMVLKAKDQTTMYLADLDKEFSRQFSRQLDIEFNIDSSQQSIKFKAIQEDVNKRVGPCIII